jgi:mannose-6-phosphate isomerase class I
VSGRFGGSLPYLLKILDVRAMLSIQAHPGQQQAAEGYRRESAAGVPVSAPNRRYTDANHKPEACVALTEFWILHGFKPLEAMADTLDGVPEWEPLAAGFRAGLAPARSDARASRRPLASFYERVMTLSQPEIDQLLGPLLARLTAPQVRHALRKDSPDFWAVRAADQFPWPDGHIDRGIFSIYLLNLVRLDPGEGIYTPAGVLHAYLEGAAVEVMASSDNVLRGGLTEKRVDVSELLRILDFSSTRPSVLAGEPLSSVERRFPTPAAEFELSRLDLGAGLQHEVPCVRGADTVLVIDGDAEIEAGGETVSLQRGAAVLVPNGMPYTLRAAGHATLYRVSVPPLFPVPCTL